MNGLPQGTSDYDMFRMNVMANSSVNSLLAQRVEQGIGRGTRGGADYCVVILTGERLVGWIGRKINLDQLTASTRAQLRMGQEVSEEVTQAAEVLPTAMKCLQRDRDWVAYHASELAEAAKAAPVDQLALRIAGAERKAYRQQRLGQFEQALATLEQLIDDREVSADAERAAWLSASAARVAYQMGEDPRGQRLQTNAFTVNNNHCPPKQRPQYRPRPIPGKQSEAIVRRLMQYERRAALLADFDVELSDLVPQPLGVVSDEQNRLVTRTSSRKRERRQSDQPNIRGRGGIIAHAKCTQQGRPLARSQGLHLLHERAQCLLKSSERQMDFSQDARHA
jgi:replicative superfamily II helicase